MKETAPYHRHYPKDHISETFGMEYATIGMYDVLRDICWTEGSIPAQPAAIAKLLKVDARKFAAAWDEMHHLFGLRDGRLIHLGIETERGRMDSTSESRSEAGRKGAERRWQKHPPATEQPSTEASQTDGKPMANAMGKNSISVCSLQFALEHPQTPTARAAPGEELSELNATAARISARHPGPNGCSPVVVARQLKAILRKIPRHARLGKLREIDANHAAWCATAKWQEEGGRFAKGLENWLAPTKGRFDEKPPALTVETVPQPPLYQHWDPDNDPEQIRRTEILRREQEETQDARV